MTDYMLAKYYRRCFIAALVLLLLIVGAWLLMKPAPQQPQPEVVIERDTVWRDTTILEPAPAETIHIGKTLLVPYIITERDTLHERDTLMVEVPVSQVRYDDSLYTAWVSGYQPALDSICLHQPTVVETITRTIVKKPPRWSIGPAIGAGISTDAQRHPAIYIGLSAQYRLWPK